jgi:hypothetical protein
VESIQQILNDFRETMHMFNIKHIHIHIACMNTTCRCHDGEYNKIAELLKERTLVFLTRDGPRNSLHKKNSLPDHSRLV